MTERLNRAVVPATGVVGRRELVASFAVSMMAMLAASKGRAGPERPAPQPPDSLIKDAYIYGFAPVAAFATERIQTAVPDSTGIVGFAPLNQFAYATELADASFSTIIRPNADTLYTLAWLDLNDQPMVISLPEVKDRYYMMALLDAYTNQFDSLGTRTTGSGAGDYLIAGPGRSGRPPLGITQVISAPTPTIWVIGRTLVRGPGDLPAVLKVTIPEKGRDGYRLIPLDRYKGPATVFIPPTNVPVIAPEPQFVPPAGKPATDADGFKEPVFFQAMQNWIAANPPPSSQQSLVATFEAVFTNAYLLTPGIVNMALAAMLAEVDDIARMVNGWGY